jgi:hypothetical protein
MWLESLTPVTSTDGEYVRLTLEGQEGENVNVDMRLNEFAGLLNVLVRFNLQSGRGDALPVESPETESPATDHTLLLAKDVDLVRWESGDSALQIQTTLGIPVQIVLSPEHVALLRRVLNESM